eukprot:CAMPEP_0195014836 /NCGR_PEP_ID=MMETSP0326_2-20130528/16673_1 /TAXON_ID=2866 ORGANISM="Crypthecodinium cohnii, Strain Seligo" /NCGR_SAMPLE_ID=MMETSP0326_2 /ASSEMBLY_ACC=CAM_ASM_000348 /LENGTH=35 /DNA_ID= /DNA_START= /DNA_END= /DNA_ORIENTATION=
MRCHWVGNSFFDSSGIRHAALAVEESFLNPSGVYP